MTDDSDEQYFQRAGLALRAPGARDDDALRLALDALRDEAFENEGRPRSDRAGTRIDRAARGRRRPLVSRGTIRFAAGLAAGIAFAAGLGIGLFAGWRMRGESVRLANAERVTPTVVGADTYPTSLRPVQFMLVAPSANRVALVGEFNDWDPAATPMLRVPGGAWHVALPLNTGRHVYAFVVDGTAWVADPQAPLAPERWFGARNSVLLVNAEHRQ
jgi:hypothetical protein